MSTNKRFSHFVKVSLTLHTPYGSLYLDRSHLETCSWKVRCNFNSMIFHYLAQLLMLLGLNSLNGI